MKKSLLAAGAVLGVATLGAIAIQQFNDVKSDTVQDFKGNVKMYTISGVICEDDGTGTNVVMGGVSVEAQGVFRGNRPYAMNTVSNPDGSYALQVPHGWTGTVAPVLESHEFVAGTCGAP